MEVVCIGERRLRWFACLLYSCHFFKNVDDGHIFGVENVDTEYISWLGNVDRISKKNHEDIHYGYKFIDGNIGVSEENIITLPLYMAAFI